MYSNFRDTIDFSLTRIQRGVKKVVSNTNNIEIPSTPSLKSMPPPSHFAVSTNWNPGLVLSKSNVNTIARKNTAQEITRATRGAFLESCSCASKLETRAMNINKRAPARGINVIKVSIG